MSSHIWKSRWVLVMLIVGLLAVLLSIACQTTPSTPTPTVNYNLEAARDKFASAKAGWEFEGSGDYVFEAEASCLCPTNNTPLMITVRNGAIESVRDIYSGEVVTDIYPHQTIDDLFREIEHALALTGFRPAPYFSAEYHPRLRYPVYFGATFSDAADHGYTLVISSYKPLNP